MNGHSKIRNKAIANIFSQMGLVEAWGSNVLSPLTFFLNSFHFPFCYELIVRSESAGFMEIISDFLTFIYRHEALFF